jgi:acyl transferase domain-containing protein/acyl carrier protein
LKTFILYSSIAGTLGSPGQANYAAANTYLDTLAHHRTNQGHPTTSLAWGLWAQDTGITQHLTTTDKARLNRTGITPLPTTQALHLLDTTLNHHHPNPTPAKLNTNSLQKKANEGTLSAMLRTLFRPTVRPVANSATGRANNASELQKNLSAASPAEQREILLHLVSDQVGAALGHSSDSSRAIDVNRPFQDLGFDSLTAVELRNRLNAATGCRLPATLVFDHPSPVALAAYLLTELEPTLGAAQPAVRRQAAAVASTSATSSTEPIAIVGMACRYPGDVDSPDALWDLVATDRDAVGNLPTRRGWSVTDLYDPDPDAAGKTYSREGGFLYDADHFDAGFFGISPREALAIDPQQRLLLETTWEAFEHAGITPEQQRGTQTGVFVGLIGQEYVSLLAQGPDTPSGHLLTGIATSVASGRIAYEFGLEGPAMTVDTACSSSLVAMHLAAQALNSGECNLAVAGGATVMANAGMFVEFSRQRGLASDGRCKSFAAAADGTSWAEGAGMLVLERLSDAQRNGHRILAVVKGSAINQDGASNGLTAPNGPSQQRVIRQALANAGLEPGDVDAVEAHGTGTSLGDPIEAQALLATYGQQRSNDKPLWLGSLKSNIGHAQAAAGVGGVIKMVMAMQNDVLPRTLHVDEPTPHVDWTAGAVRLLTEPVDWKRNGHPRRAAVSSFGISGTNAHVVLEEAPTGDDASVSDSTTIEGPTTWLISAKSPDAIRAQAARIAEFARTNETLDIQQTARALATTRTHFDQRAAVIGTDRDTLLAGLTALATDTENPALVRGQVAAGKTAFLFSGQGSQRVGAGQELYATYPVFAAAVDEACAVFDPLLGRSLRDVMFGETELLNQTLYTQPALFTLHTALYRLLESTGVRPDYLVGHSIGELSAAHAAGMLSLNDAATLVYHRARLMHQITTPGTMLAIQADETTARELIADHEDEVSLAAINAPRSTVLSGDPKILKKIATALKSRGIKTKQLTVSHAFHSPHQDQILDEFQQIADSLTYQAPQTPIVSTLTGHLADPDLMTTGEYWTKQLRHTVRHADAITTLNTLGTNHYLELTPTPTLAPLVAETLDAPPAALAPTLRNGQPEPETVLHAIATLHATGTSVNWPALLGSRPGRLPDLPTYAFQHERYWLTKPTTGTDLSHAGLTAADHPFLRAMTQLPDGTHVFSGRISAETHPWLNDHAVMETAILPGTGFVELALHAARSAGDYAVDDLTLYAPLVIPEQGAVQLNVSIEPADESGTRAIAIHSRNTGDDIDDGEWIRHAAGALVQRDAQLTQPPALASSWPPADATPLATDDLYDHLAERGYNYGSKFRGLRAAWAGGDRVYAEIELADPLSGDDTLFGIHPALLDATLHSLFLGSEDSDDDGSTVRLPFSWSGVSLHSAGASQLRATLTRTGTDTVAIAVTDSNGIPVVTVDTLSVRPIDASQLAVNKAQSLYEVGWVPVHEFPATAPSGELVIEHVISDPELDPIAAAHEVAERALTLIQAFLNDAPPTHAWLSSPTAPSPPSSASPSPTSPQPPSGAWYGLHRPNTPTAS